MGASVQVIDPRSINSWDKGAVHKSIQKTKRMMVVHETVKDFGVRVEIAAAVVKDAVDLLDTPSCG